MKFPVWYSLRPRQLSCRYILAAVSLFAVFNESPDGRVCLIMRNSSCENRCKSLHKMALSMSEILRVC